KNQLTFFLLVVLVVLALYTSYAFEPWLMQQFVHGQTFTMTMNIVRLLLWMILGLFIVRALTTLIFGVMFRLRKGYEAPTLVRNIFSVVAYIVSFAIIFKTLY